MHDLLASQTLCDAKSGSRVGVMSTRRGGKGRKRLDYQEVSRNVDGAMAIRTTEAIKWALPQVCVVELRKTSGRGSRPAETTATNSQRPGILRKMLYEQELADSSCPSRRLCEASSVEFVSHIVAAERARRRSRA